MNFQKQKYFIGLFMCLFLLVSTTGVYAQSIIGDVDGDGSVDINDALSIQRYDIGLPAMYPIESAIADINNDGIIDIYDALRIVMFNAGLITISILHDPNFNISCPSGTGNHPGSCYWIDTSGVRFASDQLSLNVGEATTIRLIAEVPEGKELRAYKFTLGYDNQILQVLNIDPSITPLLTTATNNNIQYGEVVINGVDLNGVAGPAIIAIIDVTIKALASGKTTFVIATNSFGCDVSDQFFPKSMNLNILTTIASPIDDGGEYASSSIKFTWDITGGANAYQLDIATAPNQWSIIDSIVLGDARTHTYSENLTEGKTYYARVAASFNEGSTYQNPSEFSDGIIIDLTPPTVNKPKAYRGSELSIADFRFIGTDNYAINSYQIQIASDSEFASLLKDTLIDETGMYSFQSSSGQVLYVRSRAIDGAGNQSDWSLTAGPFEIPLPPAWVSFSSSNYIIHESQGSVEITVNLSNSTSESILVEYATNNGTAVSGNDYTATSGKLTFNPGETVKTFTIPIINNGVDVNDEVFNIVLSNPVNVALYEPDNCRVRISRRQIPAPTITQPENETRFVNTTIVVRGNTEPGSIVEIFSDGVSQGTTIASSSGYFSMSGVQISQEENVITAVSTDSYGVISPVSEGLTVLLDAKPLAPAGLEATSGDTNVTITWVQNPESDIKGYNIYRDSWKLNSELLTERRFTDIGLTNAKEYSYTLTAVDNNGTESDHSRELKATPIAGTGW